MSDQDNLRNRIAYILESHAHMAMDQQACAIIDELGLTVENRLTEYGIDDPGYEYRIVGEWEPECHR